MGGPEENLGAIKCEAASRFRKVHIVADEDADAPKIQFEDWPRGAIDFAGVALGFGEVHFFVNSDDLALAVKYDGYVLKLAVMKADGGQDEIDLMRGCLL